MHGLLACIVFIANGQAMDISDPAVAESWETACATWSFAFFLLPFGLAIFGVFKLLGRIWEPEPEVMRQLMAQEMVQVLKEATDLELLTESLFYVTHQERMHLTKVREILRAELLCENPKNIRPMRLCTRRPKRGTFDRNAPAQPAPAANSSVVAAPATAAPTGPLVDAAAVSDASAVDLGDVPEDATRQPISNLPVCVLGKQSN